MTGIVIQIFIILFAFLIAGYLIAKFMIKELKKDIAALKQKEYVIISDETDWKSKNISLSNVDIKKTLG